MSEDAGFISKQSFATLAIPLIRAFFLYRSEERRWQIVRNLKLHQMFLFALLMPRRSRFLSEE